MPGVGEVRLRVAGSGCCHTDIAIWREYSGEGASWQPPLVLGHETTGWVDQIGPGVLGIDRGAAYAVYAVPGCGRCVSCVGGAMNLCATGGSPSLGLGFG